jgi:hypothetical protein
MICFRNQRMPIRRIRIAHKRSEFGGLFTRNRDRRNRWLGTWVACKYRSICHWFQGTILSVGVASGPKFPCLPGTCSCLGHPTSESMRSPPTGFRESCRSRLPAGRPGPGSTATCRVDCRRRTLDGGTATVPGTEGVYSNRLDGRNRGDDRSTARRGSAADRGQFPAAGRVGRDQRLYGGSHLGYGSRREIRQAAPATDRKSTIVSPVRLNRAVRHNVTAVIADRMIRRDVIGVSR